VVVRFESRRWRGPYDTAQAIIAQSRSLRAKLAATRTIAMWHKDEAAELRLLCYQARLVTLFRRHHMRRYEVVLSPRRSCALI
jgi:hypothetical protein